MRRSKRQPTLRRAARCYQGPSQKWPSHARELLVQAESDEIVGKMKVLAVLEALPGTGKVKARRLMETVGISETRRLQGLGAKQREALLEAAARP